MAGREAHARAQEPDYKSLLIAAGVQLPTHLAGRISALREDCLEMERNREKLPVLARRRRLQVSAIEKALRRVDVSMRMVQHLDDDVLAQAFGSGDTAEFASRFEASAVGEKRRALLRAFGDLIRELERERESCIADIHPRYRKKAQKRMHRGLFKALGYEPSRVGWQPEFQWFFGELVKLIENECGEERVAVRLRMLQAICNALFPDVQHSPEAVKLARMRVLRPKAPR